MSPTSYQAAPPRINNFKYLQPERSTTHFGVRPSLPDQPAGFLRPARIGIHCGEVLRPDLRGRQVLSRPLSIERVVFGAAVRNRSQPLIADLPRFELVHEQGAASEAGQATAGIALSDDDARGHLLVAVLQALFHDATRARGRPLRLELPSLRVGLYADPVLQVDENPVDRVR